MQTLLQYLQQRCPIRYLLETTESTICHFDPLLTSIHYSLLFVKQGNSWKPHHLTEPKTPLLQTSLRARPPKVKSSLELEQEELQNIPKFKAKPLNKKVIVSSTEILPISKNLLYQLTNRNFSFRSLKVKGILEYSAIPRSMLLNLKNFILPQMKGFHHLLLPWLIYLARY